MARTATLPVLNGESGLSRYLAEIRKFPMLEPQQEYMFAKRWREHDDRDAAHHLVGVRVARCPALESSGIVGQHGRVERALAGRAFNGDLGVEEAAEVDRGHDQEQKNGKDDCEFDECLAALTDEITGTA